MDSIRRFKNREHRDAMNRTRAAVWADARGMKKIMRQMAQEIGDQAAAKSADQFHREVLKGKGGL